MQFPAPSKSRLERKGEIQVPHIVAQLTICEAYLDFRTLCMCAQVSTGFKQLAYYGSSLGHTLDLSGFGAKLSEENFRKLHQQRVRFKGERRVRHVSVQGCTHLSAKALAEFVSQFNTNPLLPAAQTLIKSASRPARVARTSTKNRTSTANNLILAPHTGQYRQHAGSTSTHQNSPSPHADTTFSTTTSNTSLLPAQYSTRGSSNSNANTVPTYIPDAFGRGLRLFVWEAGSAGDWEVQRVLYRTCDMWCSVRHSARQPLSIELFLWIRSEAVRRSVSYDELHFATQALRDHPDLHDIIQCLLTTCHEGEQPNNIVPQKIHTLQDAAIYSGTICPGNCCLQVMAKQPSEQRLQAFQERQREIERSYASRAVHGPGLTTVYSAPAAPRLDGKP